jgi:hypothetical protein
VKLGDANTRFFHNKATINYRNNFISMLRDESLSEITDHEGMREKLKSYGNHIKKEWGKQTSQTCNSICKIFLEKAWTLQLVHS